MHTQLTFFSQNQRLPCILGSPVSRNSTTAALPQPAGPLPRLSALNEPATRTATPVKTPVASNSSRSIQPTQLSPKPQVPQLSPSSTAVAPVPILTLLKLATRSPPPPVPTSAPGVSATTKGKVQVYDKKPDATSSPTSLCNATVLCDFAALDKDELTLILGEVVVCLDRTNSDWWYGSCQASPKRGYFPSAYVSLMVESDVVFSKLYDHNVINGNIPMPARAAPKRPSGAAGKGAAVVVTPMVIKNRAPPPPIPGLINAATRLPPNPVQKLIPASSTAAVLSLNSSPDDFFSNVMKTLDERTISLSPSAGTSPSGDPFQPKIADDALTVTAVNNQDKDKDTTEQRNATVLCDFEALDKDEMSLTLGEAVVCLDRTNSDWWYGTSQAGQKKGHFPSAYVSLITQTFEDDSIMYANIPKAIVRRAAPSRPVSTVSISQSTSVAVTNVAVVKEESQIIYTALSFTSASHRHGGEVVPAPAAVGGYARAPPPPITTAMKIKKPLDVVVDVASTSTASIPKFADAAEDESPPSYSASIQVLTEIAANTAAAAGASVSEIVDLTDDDQGVLFCVVSFPYEGMDVDQLTMQAGDTIEILSCHPDQAWWSGLLRDKEGWFPASYVVLCDPPKMDDDQDTDKSDNAKDEAIRRKTKSQQVLKEIFDTERAHVKVLSAIVDGYLFPMRRKVGTLFLEKSIDIIFSNLEQLVNYHLKFLTALESTVEGVPGSQENINVGACFVQYADGFKICSVYCSNFSRAETELTKIQQNDRQIQAFFTGCRLLSEDSFELFMNLLKPVQRILKYPMLLKELMKYTEKKHPDFPSICKAHAVFEKLATTINEEKRQKEQLVLIQNSIDGWEGSDLTDTSTSLIHEGALMKISDSKAQERYFYLFDNVILYCKRLMSGKFELRGKIFTDKMDVHDLPDGEKQGGKVLKNSFRVHNTAKNKWYILNAKTVEEKQVWLDSFLKERLKVESAKDAGVNIVLKEGANNSTVDEEAVKARQKQVAKAMEQLGPVPENKTGRRQIRRQ